MPAVFLRASLTVSRLRSSMSLSVTTVTDWDVAQGLLALADPRFGGTKRFRPLGAPRCSVTTTVPSVRARRRVGFDLGACAKLFIEAAKISAPSGMLAATRAVPPVLRGVLVAGRSFGASRQVSSRLQGLAPWRCLHIRWGTGSSPATVLRIVKQNENDSQQQIGKMQTGTDAGEAMGPWPRGAHRRLRVTPGLSGTMGPGTVRRQACSSRVQRPPGSGLSTQEIVTPACRRVTTRPGGGGQGSLAAGSGWVTKPMRWTPLRRAAESTSASVW